MSPLKEQVIRIIAALPEEATMDDVMEKLYFKSQVDQGLKELDEGKGLSHEKVQKKFLPLSSRFLNSQSWVGWFPSIKTKIFGNAFMVITVLSIA